MSQEKLVNHVKRFRFERGWSQGELATRAGISRAEVSAIEVQRLVPSVAAALSLANVFKCRVEDLFGSPDPQERAPRWAWPPAAEPCRYWQAEVGGQTLLFPAEAASLAAPGHDGVCTFGAISDHSHYAPAHTLVMACCDPAAAFLAAEFARSSHFRLIVIPRSSADALRLLAEGLVHVAGVHLTKAGAKLDQAALVRKSLGTGYSLLHVACWDEGLAVGPAQRISSVKQALKSKLEWVGREPGSGAQNCLDEIAHGQVTPTRIARSHRAVAEAIRDGWADIGVCLRLVAEEARLQFLSVRHESYDLVYRTADDVEPRLRALREVVSSLRYRELLSELPGYDTTRIGTTQAIV